MKGMSTAGRYAHHDDELHAEALEIGIEYLRSTRSKALSHWCRRSGVLERHNFESSLSMIAA